MNQLAVYHQKINMNRVNPQLLQEKRRKLLLELIRFEALNENSIEII